VGLARFFGCLRRRISDSWNLSIWRLGDVRCLVKPPLIGTESYWRRDEGQYDRLLNSGSNKIFGNSENQRKDCGQVSPSHIWIYQLVHLSFSSPASDLRSLSLVIVNLKLQFIVFILNSKSWRLFYTLSSSKYYSTKKYIIFQLSPSFSPLRLLSPLFNSLQLQSNKSISRPSLRVPLQM
jgi:hypothetical protein